MESPIVKILLQLLLTTFLRKASTKCKLGETRKQSEFDGELRKQSEFDGELRKQSVKLRELRKKSAN